MTRKRIFLACGTSVLLLVVLCILLPLGWWYYYYPWQYCWFPPQNERIQVLVSACTNPTLYSVSPDGRFMLYADWEGNRNHTWIHNLVTGQRRSSPGLSFYWLNNTLVPIGSFSIYGNSLRIWDVTDSTITPLQRVQALPNTLIPQRDGSNQLNPQVADWFRAAETVYYIPFDDLAIALASDFKDHPEQNYAIARGYNEQPKQQISAKAFLEEYHIPYQVIESANAQRSHDGNLRYTLLYDALSFSTSDGRELATIPLPQMGYFDRESWTFDDSGVVGQHFVSDGLIIFQPEPARQPILKVNVPPQFLLPTQTP